MGRSLSQISFDFTTEEMSNPPAEKLKPPAPERILVQENKPDNTSMTGKNISDPDPDDKEQIPARKSTRGRLSLKEVHLSADLIQVPTDEDLFKKQYYSIGEVAGWFRVNQSLIRYWETEFDILQPRKNRKGDRFFRPVDVKNLVLIYDLLRRRKFTIEGAKEFLKRNNKAEEKFAMIQSLEKLKSFLNELKASI